MSSQTPVPIAAPWQSSYQRYPVQTFPMSGTALNVTAVVPANQWWRPVWVTGALVTGATVQDRAVVLVISPRPGSLNLNFPTSGTVGASASLVVNAYPNAQAYQQSTFTAAPLAIVGYPDLIWPPKTGFQWLVANSAVGDAFTAASCAIGVEIYTEDYSAPGTLVPTATPVLV